MISHGEMIIIMLLLVHNWFSIRMLKRMVETDKEPSDGEEG